MYMALLNDTWTGTILDAIINAPGSWHDSRVALPVYAHLRRDTPDGPYLVADTAFPRGSRLSGKIMAPLNKVTACQVTHFVRWNI